MRAVVLARGLGTRMRAHDPGAPLTDAQRRAAESGHKALMPIHGRPFLDYVLSALADAGVSEIALVVAPDHDALRDHYRTKVGRTRIAFVVQAEALGTADAVLAAERWTGGQPFLAMNADNLYPVGALRGLAALDEPGLPAFDADDLVRTGNIPAERIAAFAVLDVDERGYLRSIVEKPRADLPAEAGSDVPGSDVAGSDVAGSDVAGSDVPESYVPESYVPESYVPGSYVPGSYVASAFRRKISMNLWRFDARIFAACRDVPRSPRGEFELPEAVGLAMTRGVRFRVIPARGPVLDLSRRSDAADVERRLAGLEPRP